MSLAQLSAMILPDSVSILRDAPPRTKVINDSFWDQYDRKTFFYDVFWDEENRVIQIFAPRLLNLEVLLRNWLPMINGRSVQSVRLRRNQKFDQIMLGYSDFSSAQKPVLECNLAGVHVEIPIQTRMDSFFQGRNVLCTVSKNNNIVWIKDWMAFHHRQHGADALLLFDNGSSLYQADELQKELEKVDGFESVCVVSAPFPYGPSHGMGRGQGRSKFLQVSLLNLARERFLKKARAVLSIDVDELVMSHTDHSIFDWVAGSYWGFTAFEGEWRYAVSSLDIPLHHDHLLLKKGEKPCPSKYCYRPQSWLGRQTLDVHGLLRFGRRWFPRSSDFHFTHCRSITTSWKEQRLTPKNGLVMDERLHQIWFG